MIVGENITERIAAFVLPNEAEALLENQRAEQPDWPGTITNGVEHWTGVLVPRSQSLANAIGWEVFDQFVYNPFATWGYETPADRLDKGADGVAPLQLYYEASLGPAEAGSAAPTARELDYRTAAGAYDGYASWTVIDAVNFRYAKAKLTFTNANGKVVLSKQVLAYSDV